MAVAALLPASATAAPRADDFERELPAVERVAPAGPGKGAGEVSWRSPVVAAPARFDAAGLAGELRPLELRARERGGPWSDWVETANGDPAWFGDARELQVRSHGWRPEGTLHFVDVIRASRTTSSKLGGGGTGDGGGGTGGGGDGDGRRPKMIGRGAWGANRNSGGCDPRRRPDMGKVKAGVVHHTVNANSYSRGEAKGIVLAICRYHRNANGWNDIGYNALVDRFGRTYVGRAGGMRNAVVGAHAQGYNDQTAGVAAIGSHQSASISRPAMTAFVQFFAWKLLHHGRPARGRTTLISRGGEVNRYPRGRRVRVNRLTPHGKLDYSECPGGRLQHQLHEMRERVANRARRIR